MKEDLELLYASSKAQGEHDETVPSLIRKTMESHPEPEGIIMVVVEKEGLSTYALASSEDIELAILALQDVLRRTEDGMDRGMDRRLN